MKKIYQRIIITLLLFPLGVTAVHAQDFASGTGTESDPYIIKTIAHLENVRQYLGPDNAKLYFAMDSDLDMSNIANWAPIGTPSQKEKTFFGTFDGRGHVIRNITLKSDETPPYMVENLGLFSLLNSGAIVKNVGIENGYIEAKASSAGFIAGQNGGVIENCFAVGVIRGNKSSNLGGITGFMWTMDYSGPSAAVNGSYAIVDIENSGFALVGITGRMGGIAGYCITSTVSRCFALCRVIGERQQELGGITGTLSRGRIEYSYAYGYAKGQMLVGGILGYQYQTNYVTTSYAVMQISKSKYIDELTLDYQKMTFGGILGATYSTLEVIKGCYFNSDVFQGEGIGVSGSGLYKDGALELTSEEMLHASKFEEMTWKFGSDWDIWEDNTYPYFINRLTPVSIKKAIPTRAEGTFSSEDIPEKVILYSINANRMERLGEAVLDKTDASWHIDFKTPLNVSEYVYALAYRDKQYSSPSILEIENNYFQRGEGIASDPFVIKTAEQLRNVRHYLGEASKGTYFVIENDIDFKNEPAWIPLNNEGVKSFYGNINGSNYTIKNLTIQLPDTDSVGLFAAIGNSGVVANINCVGWNVKGKNNTGAICGVNEGTIDDCSVFGEINGNDNVGGICGTNKNIINDCYTIVTLKSTGTNNGGFCGVNAANASISKSYAMGEITGNAMTGGFCGTNEGALNMVFAGCTISATGQAGGLCASNTGTATACYFDKDAASISSADIEGIKGLTSAEMKKKNQFVYWDFSTIGGIWGIWENNTYPYFGRQTAPPVITKVTPTLVSGICNNVNSPDSIVLYRNYERVGQCVPELTGWQISLPTPFEGSDVVYAIAYLAGKEYSRPALVSQLPNDALLKTLSTDAGSLIPSFSPAILNYTIMPVENTISQMNIMATAKNSNATVAGTGNKSLMQGNNKFIISVVSEDGSTSTDYTLTVIRKNTNYTPSDDASLKVLDAQHSYGGSLIAGFTPDNTNYNASVVNNVSQVAITATSANPYATVSGTGLKNLEVGENTFTVTVTAENGSTTKNYTIVITRHDESYTPSSDALLKGLSLSEGTLSPVFNGTTYEYTAASTMNEVMIIATANHAGAQVTGAGVKMLEIGTNIFNVVVTAEDGIAKLIYKITIERALPSDVKLEGISIANQPIDCSTGTSFGYVAPCGISAADIKVYANQGSSVYINGRQGNTYHASIPELGYEKIIITLVSADQLKTKQYELALVRSLPSSVIVKRWDNVLALVDNPEKNGGLYFKSYQWYKNGNLMQDATKPYIWAEGASSQYMLEVVTTEGYTLRTCPLSDIKPSHESIIAYPNPVRSGGTVNLQMPEGTSENIRMTVNIINMQGVVEKQVSVSGTNPSIAMPAHPGIYLLQIVDKEKHTQTLKVITY